MALGSPWILQRPDQPPLPSPSIDTIHRTQPTQKPPGHAAPPDHTRGVFFFRVHPLPEDSRSPLPNNPTQEATEYPRTSPPRRACN